MCNFSKGGEYMEDFKMYKYVKRLKYSDLIKKYNIDNVAINREVYINKKKFMIFYHILILLQ